MHFYRSMSAIKAITFDLDDTLYDNATIVENAESKLIDALNQLGKLGNLTLTEYYAVKSVVLNHHPEIYHDVIAWRSETIKYILQKAPRSKHQIQQIIDESMSLFTDWRHAMTVPQSSYDLLIYLANKYPLAVITNGNVDINRIGLKDYFQFSLRGGADGRSKPFPEVFQLAVQKLSVDANHILHIGDSLSADVNGAIKSGLQSCWINIDNQDIKHLSDAKCLPHFEISQLPELYNLL